MRRFNPEKELRNIQHGNRNKIIFGVMALLLIISIGSTYALYQVRYSKRIIYTKVAPFSNHDINILAVYLDNQPTTDFPEKNSGYRYDHIVCDNGSTATFDSVKWKLVLEAGGKDKCNVYFVKTYKDASGANAPELYQGLIPITFDSSGNVKVADVTSTTGWYNYGSKQWANAVLVDSTNYNKYVENGEYKSNTTIPMTEILQMYVWIPRYKYQLFNVDNQGVEEQEIQIQFENNTSTTGAVRCSTDAIGKETCTGATKGAWYTHPAFKFGDTDLTGIWVGKFETSGNTSALTIKPTITSLRNINIKTMFDASRNIEEASFSKFNLNKKEIDTHMMKNIEWGATAYLTHSKYGRCTPGSNCEEVAKNSTSSYLTGYANTSYQWNTLNGQKASTTGNMYGIYDTNGGAWECMMTVIMNASGTNVNYSSTGFSSNTMPDKKYYELYEYGTSDTNHSRGHLGDATRETLKTTGNLYGGWHGDWSGFPLMNSSWFVRGGYNSDNDVIAGTFAYGRNSGAATEILAFRVIITAEDK